MQPKRKKNQKEHVKGGAHILRVLIVEDQDSDVELVEHELRNASLVFESRRAETAEEFSALLKSFEPDIVISDYLLPQFDGMTALRLLKENSPLTPMIIATDSVNEEMADEFLKAGADDYVLKNHFVRLGAAVRGALEKKEAKEIQRRTERALHESEARFRAMTETVACAIFIYQDSRFLYANPAMEAITGYTRDELMQMSFLDVVHPDHRDLVRKHGHDRRHGGHVPPHYEYKIVTKSGEERWIDFRAKTIEFEGHPATLGSAFDITDRRQTENEMRLMAFAVSCIKDPFCITDMDNVILFANRAFVDLYGYSERELTGTTIDIVRPSLFSSQLGEEIRQKTIAGGWHGEIINRRKDGTEFPVELWTSVVYNDLGEPVALVGVSRDITERKNAERALRESERRFRALIEKTTDGVVTLDSSGTITYAGPSVTTILGYSVEELIGKSAFDLVYPEDLGRVRQLFGQLLGEPQSSRGSSFRAARKDGSVRWIEGVATNLLHDPSVSSIVANFRDITDRRALEERLLHAQRMESIGTLAGGVAHDFNNILGIIMGHASALESGKLPPDRWGSSVRAIAKASERGASLVRQLLTFARKSSSFPQSISINPMVDELVRLMSETFPRSIEIVSELAEESPVVVGDPHQVHQALLNLCLNARDALMEPRADGSEGGVLTIRTGSVSSEELREKIEKPVGERYAFIEVEDTGIGMDEETRKRIFEPFFTTKEVGKGTGLGLAAVYGIAKSHDGHIDVESELGKGARFRLFLPLGQSVPTEIHIGEQNVAENNSGKEKILVVEDEMMLADLVKLMLEENGYRVEVAKDGVEAVEVFRQQKDEIDLILTDMGLPRLGGWEAVQEMRKLRPDVRVILASGYLDPQLYADRLANGADEFVQKPYNPQEILRTIRRILDSRTS